MDSDGFEPELYLLADCAIHYHALYIIYTPPSTATYTYINILRARTVTLFGSPVIAHRALPGFPLDTRK